MAFCGDFCLRSVCCGNVSPVGAPSFFFCMLAELGNAMADLLAAHFNSGLVAAKLGGGERPMCGNSGTGTLWRDLGFVAQRYVVKVLWYHRVLCCFYGVSGSSTWLSFSFKTIFSTRLDVCMFIPNQILLKYVTYLHFKCNI